MKLTTKQWIISNTAKKTPFTTPIQNIIVQSVADVDFQRKNFAMLTTVTTVNCLQLSTKLTIQNNRWQSNNIFLRVCGSSTLYYYTNSVVPKKKVRKTQNYIFEDYFHIHQHTHTSSRRSKCNQMILNRLPTYYCLWIEIRLKLNEGADSPRNCLQLRNKDLQTKKVSFILIRWLG